MKKWKGVVAGILIAGGIAGGILCYEKKEDGKEKVQVAVSFCDTDNARTTAVWKDVLKHLSEAELSVEWKNAEADIEKQQADIQELIEYEPEYLVVMPVKTIGLEQELQQAADNDIKIIFLDRTMDVQEKIQVLAEIRTDQRWEGKACADLLEAYFQDRPGHILELRGENGSSINKEHSTGFRNQLRNYDNLEITGSIEGNGDREISRANVMNYLMNSRKTVNAIFANTDEEGIGAVHALEELGLREEIPVVSINGTKDVKMALLAGGYLGSVEAVPYLGETLTEVILKDMQGQEVSSENILPGRIFTVDNIEEMQGY